MKFRSCGPGEVQDHMGKQVYYVFLLVRVIRHKCLITRKYRLLLQLPQGESISETLIVNQPIITCRRQGRPIFRLIHLYTD